MDEDEIAKRVSEAIENPPHNFFARRKIDKSAYQVIKDTDPNGPISDKTQEVIFEGSYDDCEIMALDLQKLSKARAAIAAYKSALAEAAYVIVPREPTEQMIETGEQAEFAGEEFDEHHPLPINCDECVLSIWHAMIDAAPKL